MTSDYQFMLGAYGFIVIISLTIPFITCAIPHRRRDASRENFVFLTALFLVSAFLYRVLGPLHLATPLVLSFAFLPLVAISGTPRTAASLAAFIIFATTTWWMHEPRLTFIRCCVFLWFGYSAVALTYFYKSGKGVAGGLTLALGAGLGALANVLTGPLTSPAGFMNFWHHWSVFIAPAQLMTAGAIPFVDFPLQYGFGPTTLIAAGCLWECWSGAYAIIALCNLAFLLCMIGSAILLLRDTPKGQAVCAVSALVLSILLWATSPADLSGTLAYPSTGGIRFLPLSFLLFFVVAREINQTNAKWIGHLLWLIGVLWSPEAAYFSTLVWWPYLALRSIDQRSLTKPWPIAKTAIGGAVNAVLSLGVTIAVSMLVFRCVFGEWPSIEVYLAYITNPPGPLPANIYGPVWLLLSSLLIGLYSLFISRPQERRIIAVLLLGFVGVCTYYLSRSHDNNVLNLFPFMALLLIGALRLNLPATCDSFGKAILIAIVAWPATFGLTKWSTAWQEKTATSVGMGEVFSRLKTASSWHLVGPISDVGEAYDKLLGTGDGVPVLIGPIMVLLPQQDPAQTWTTVTNIANYAPLPEALTQAFIKKGAEKFKRPGWILVDRENSAPWLDLFKTSYNLSEKRSFGGYDGYRLVPK